jgi:hypothetical protein
VRAAAHFCAEDDRLEHEALQQMQARGIAAVALSDEEQQHLDGQIAAVRQQWVDSMTRRGLPGQDALDAFNAAR